MLADPGVHRMKAEEAEQMLATLQRGRSTPKLGRTLLADLDQRVEEVVMWCRRYANPQSIRGSLRPARLAPHPLAADRWSAVEGVAAVRRSELGRAPDVTLDGISGRLLVYFPDLARPDDAAEQASKGLFDLHAAPPCGSWVGYFDQGDRQSSRSACLLAWLPQMFVSLASEGIAANSEHAVAWLDNANVPLRHITAHLQTLRIIG
jgi:hypothetical protein